ncbi:MAG TPA: hypothetical protein VIL69_05775 [Roseomonas sp.]|jgi:hypothetical protein
MLKPRMRAGLIGLGLIGLTALPAAAQSWPSESGPTGDFLGATIRQFDRLAPPPVEAAGRGERPVPGMPVTDLPGGSVDVGRPAIVSAPQPDQGATLRRAARRGTGRHAVTATPARRPRNREAQLARELAERDRRIQQLEQQIEQDRRAQGSQSAGALYGSSPASAVSTTLR